MHRRLSAFPALLTVAIALAAALQVQGQSRGQGARVPPAFEYDVLASIQRPKLDSNGEPVWDRAIDLRLTCGWHDSSPGCVTYYQWKVTCSNGKTHFQGEYRGRYGEDARRHYGVGASE